MPRSVQFNEPDSMKTGQRKKKGTKNNKHPLLVRWVMKLPFVNDRSQADKVLIAAAVIILLISAYFWWDVVA